MTPVSNSSLALNKQTRLLMRGEGEFLWSKKARGKIYTGAGCGEGEESSERLAGSPSNV